MMSIETVKKANELVGKIERTERLIAAYRAAEEVTVSLSGGGGFGKDAVTLTAEEIGDVIVGSLARRVALLHEQLVELGVE
jgi:hypothetical protein